MSGGYWTREEREDLREWINHPQRRDFNCPATPMNAGELRRILATVEALESVAERAVELAEYLAQGAFAEELIGMRAELAQLEP